MTRGSPHEAFAAAALPVLLHRMRNATQALVSVRALVDELGSEPMPASCGRAIASAADDAHELGWLFGLVSGCLGADVLLGRCEPRGLATALDLARDALAREERVLTIAGPVPDLAPGRDGGPQPWRVAASLATLAWHCGSASPRAAYTSIAFARSDAALVLRGDCAETEPAFARAALDWLPGCELARDGDAWRVTLAPDWIGFPR